MILIVGCGDTNVRPGPGQPDAGARADTGTSVDTGASADTGSSRCEDAPLNSGTEPLAADAAELAGEMTFGTCGVLIDPWVMAEPGNLEWLWNLTVDDNWSGTHSEFEFEDACPCDDDGDDDDDGTAWEGPCTTSTGWHVVGGFDGWASSGGTAGTSAAAWGIGFEDDDGTYEALSHGTEGTGTAPHYWRRRIANSGRFDNGWNGTWVRDGVVSPYSRPATGQMYLLVVDSEAVPPGDACVTLALAYTAGCPEPDGVLQVTGADVVTVEFDGESACDGCGEVHVDGLEAGEACFSVFAPPDQSADPETVVENASTPSCGCASASQPGALGALWLAIGTRRRHAPPPPARAV